MAHYGETPHLRVAPPDHTIDETLIIILRMNHISYYSIQFTNMLIKICSTFHGCTLSSINCMKAVHVLLDNPRTPINFVISITGEKPVLGLNSMIPYIKKVRP